MVFKSLGLKASAVAASSAFVLAACSGGGARLAPTYMPQTAPFAMPGIVSPAAGTAVKKIVWGKLPKATAGKAFAKPVAVTITAKGSNGKPISGAYASPILLTNSDKTGASVLLVNGKPASNKNGLTSSSDKLTLKYSGLAIVAATFNAASGKTKAKANFAPALANIVYTGPSVSGPEIDLTSTTPATPGYQGNFTATQAGWTPNPFKKPFKYAFAAVGGFANNCSTAFTVTPASGKPGTAFTVKAKAGAAAGECTMTLTGGANKKLAVLLTYTTTSVGVNGEQAPH